MGAPIAAEVATHLPQWAVYAFSALGALVGLLIAFVLGSIRYAISQRGGAGIAGDGSARGGRRDCSDCPSIDRIDSGLNALNSRIDRILELKAGG